MTTNDTNGNETGEMLPGLGYSHSDLVLRAEKWLKAFGCKVVFREFVAYTPSGEIPDALGWKGGFSILIECKATRSDFLSDKRKVFRQNPELGIGSTRFYMCPPDVIQLEDLPDGWGLLWVYPKMVKRMIPFSNYIPPAGPIKNFHDRCLKGEVAMLLSALRRLQIRGHFDEIYDGAGSIQPVREDLSE